MTMPLETLSVLVEERRLPIAVSSKEVVAGGVFVALPPAVPVDSPEAGGPGGEVWIADAVSKGAAYVVCEERHISLARDACANATCGVVAVASPRRALGVLAAAAFGTRVGRPEIIGITGTNGKTTTSYLLEHLLTSLGRKTGVIGTVEYRWPGFSQEAPLTTPGCLALHGLLAQMRDAGVDTALMEVSSHALEQERVAGLAFSGAMLTNVTQDHLDYHKTMDAYFAAKARLFKNPENGGTPVAGKARAINADDLYGRRLLAESPGSVAFGMTPETAPGNRYLHGKVESLTPEGLCLRMSFEGRSWRLFSHLTGAFNAMNLLGVQALGLALGLKPEDFASLEKFTGVPGRLERVANARGLHAFVDYAHTPDALVNVLTALRAAGFERIVTVFGCGGNRDRTKRPLMGEAVAAHSDVAVLTSDNPRDEDPEAIMADVAPGLVRCAKVFTEPDRRAAIKLAAGLVGPNDALLVAGKGHEPYQLIKGVKYPFSDQAVLREILECC